VLLRLAGFTADADLEQEAVGALRRVADGMARAPGAFGHALCALDRLLGPRREVAIVGDPGADDTRALLAEASVRSFRPNTVLALASPDDDRARATIPLLRDRTMAGGAATAFVCEGFACRLPVTEPAALGAQLDELAG
jgi:uncharacterized protein YyaL (SSP411 family)